MTAAIADMYAANNRGRPLGDPVLLLETRDDVLHPSAGHSSVED